MPLAIGMAIGASCIRPLSLSTFICLPAWFEMHSLNEYIKVLLNDPCKTRSRCDRLATLRIYAINVSSFSLIGNINSASKVDVVARWTFVWSWRCTSDCPLLASRHGCREAIRRVCRPRCVSGPRDLLAHRWHHQGHVRRPQWPQLDADGEHPRVGTTVYGWSFCP